MQALYLKGKVYELLSLYFNKNEDADSEQCPFLVDEENVRKIRKAKDIVLNQMAEPFTGVRDEIELSLSKLKDGSSNCMATRSTGIYSRTMEEARRMLELGSTM